MSTSVSKPMYCATCFGKVYYLDSAKAWFHWEGAAQGVGSIAREVTDKEGVPLKPVMPAPNHTPGFSVPKHNTGIPLPQITGRTMKVRIT